MGVKKNDEDGAVKATETKVTQNPEVKQDDGKSVVTLTTPDKATDPKTAEAEQQPVKDKVADAEVKEVLEQAADVEADAPKGKPEAKTQAELLAGETAAPSVAAIEAAAQDTVANVDPYPEEREDVAQLELLGYKRLVLGGRLFERGVVYDMLEGDAEQLLRVRTDDGRPTFGRYVLEEKATNDSIVRRAPLPNVAKVAMPVRVVADTATNSKAIEIGTEEELIEAGLIAKDAADVVAELNKGESVEL
ncbi:ribonuclease E [Stenotrophomonas phage vB_SmaS_DLP_3]|nr:ribonuclease E [Stenotrophomonas phage vB_SmaS_DLP_3]